MVARHVPVMVLQKGLAPVERLKEDNMRMGMGMEVEVGI